METQQAPPRLLFVDDEPGILKSLTRLMMDEDFEILTAASGPEGIELLRRDPEVALIVSDQRMPGMSGAEFLEAAAEIAPQALRMVLTGYADVTAAVDAINRGGACRYIAKPWNDQELLQILRDGVERYNLLREKERLNAIIQAKNEELAQWNTRLKSRVLQQTAQIREKNDELRVQNSRLRRNNQEIIAAFSGLIELRAKTLRNHTRNVTEVAVRVARELDLPAEEIETLKTAAMLHDIGEIGNPDHLMGSDWTQLSGPDLEAFMLHTIRGQAAIDVIEELRPAGVLIRHHHEHFGGEGYPDGLKGEDIPLAARILTAADYLDQEVKRIPEGQLGVEMETVLKKVNKVAGRYLDPQIVPYLGRPAKEVYGAVVHEHDRVLGELDPQDLRIGMILREDLYTSTDLMLLSKGSYLTTAGINAILRHHRLYPFRKKIPVLIPKEMARD